MQSFTTDHSLGSTPCELCLSSIPCACTCTLKDDPGVKDPGYLYILYSISTPLNKRSLFLGIRHNRRDGLDTKQPMFPATFNNVLYTLHGILASAQGELGRDWVHTMHISRVAVLLVQDRIFIYRE